MRPRLPAVLLLPLIFTSCQPAGPSGKSPAPSSSVTDIPSVRVQHPQKGEVISNPLRVTGEARGRWYFEGSFPIMLRDASGNSLGESYVTAQGEWMTPNFVPFAGEIRFATPSTATGALILNRANASGLPEHDEQVVLPVRFSRD